MHSQHQELCTMHISCNLQPVWQSRLHIRVAFVFEATHLHSNCPETSRQRPKYRAAATMQYALRYCKHCCKPYICDRPALPDHSRDNPQHTSIPQLHTWRQLMLGCSCCCPSCCRCGCCQLHGWQSGRGSGLQRALAAHCQSSQLEPPLPARLVG